MNELEETILDTVTGRQGCKYVELVTALAERSGVEEAVERMVADGTLIERVPAPVNAVAYQVVFVAGPYEREGRGTGADAADGRSGISGCLVRHA